MDFAALTTDDDEELPDLVSLDDLEEANRRQFTRPILCQDYLWHPGNEAPGHPGIYWVRERHLPPALAWYAPDSQTWFAVPGWAIQVSPTSWARDLFEEDGLPFAHGHVVRGATKKARGRALGRPSECWSALA